MRLEIFTYQKKSSKNIDRTNTFVTHSRKYVSLSILLFPFTFPSSLCLYWVCEGIEEYVFSKTFLLNSSVQVNLLNKYLLGSLYHMTLIKGCQCTKQWEVWTFLFKNGLLYLCNELIWEILNKHDIVSQVKLIPPSKNKTQHL